MALRFHPVTPDRWPDFEQLFESRGAPHYCWCMLWRVNAYKASLPGKAGKKAAMRDSISESVPVGLLAYDGDEPVAWCSIAPRATFRPMRGDDALSDVWSVTCFFVKRPLRKQGVTSQLLAAAIAYARANGARHVEAYPVAPDSPTYRYMGVVPMFEQAGFEYVKPAGTRRHVMVLTF